VRENSSSPQTLFRFLNAAFHVVAASRKLPEFPKMYVQIAVIMVPSISEEPSIKFNFHGRVLEVL